MIREFTARMAEDILDYLPEEMQEGVEVKPTEIIKMNDQRLYGLSFFKGDKPAPTYYINDMFNLFLLGADPEELLQDLAEAYVAQEQIPLEPTELPELEFSKIRGKIGLRLLEIERNKEYLKTVPYREMGCGFALICEIRIDAPDGGFFSTIITNAMAEEYHYDIDRLFDGALEKAWRSNAASLRPATELIDPDSMDAKALMTKDPKQENFFILSTDQQRYGAAALFYPGTQAMVAHVLKEDYYAIPSSVHEFIIIRKSGTADVNRLQRLVIDANNSIVRPDEVLSDHLLQYSRKSKRLSRVPFEERSDYHAETRVTM